MASLNDNVWLDAKPITKSDTVVYDVPFMGLWIGGLGDVAVVTYNGTTLTFSAVPAGTRLPIAVKQVLSAGTTATLIAGFR